MITPWVRQEHSCGCGVAACAMIMGRTYSETLRIFDLPADHDLEATGLSEFVLEGVLAGQGFAWAKVYRLRQPANRARHEWPVAPWADKHLVQVSTGSGAHYVVMLGDGSILDPVTPDPKKLSDYKQVYWIAAVGKLPGARHIHAAA